MRFINSKIHLTKIMVLELMKFRGVAASSFKAKYWIQNSLLQCMQLGYFTMSRLKFIIIKNTNDKLLSFGCNIVNSHKQGNFLALSNDVPSIIC